MTLHGHGARDVSAALGRPDLRQWIEALRLLGQIGAQPPSDAVGGAIEILQRPILRSWSRSEPTSAGTRA